MSPAALTKPRLPGVFRWQPTKEHAWRDAFVLLGWLLLIYSCLRTWQVIDGRMYYLLDSDMSSELVLSNLLRREHALLTPDWYYSTELRVFNIHWAFTPLFFLFDNWLKVRKVGTAIILLLMFVSCWYFCRQAGISRLFPWIGTLLIFPVTDVYFRILLLTLSYAPYITADFLCLGLLFQYAKGPRRRTGAALLAVQFLFAVLLGTNGMRQLLILYLPLFAAVLVLCVLHSTHRRDAVAPELPAVDRRLLASSFAALAGSLVGWLINAKYLRYHYHYTSQEGVKFTPFRAERLEQLFTGWLESFGFQGGDYITSTQLFYNAFCFLALLICLCAFISFLRRPQDYTLPEKVIALFALFGFVIYHALYLFSDMTYYTRYNLPIVVLMMPVAVEYLYRLPLCRVLRGAGVGVMAALLLWCGNDYYTKLWPVNMTANHEAAVAALRAAGYTEGYASFWNANIMVELSNGAFDIRVWDPTAHVDDPDNLYEWLQAADHFDTHPEGPVFLFLQKGELDTIFSGVTLDEGTVEFENDNYIAYGYPSYDAMRTDFYD